MKFLISLFLLLGLAPTAFAQSFVYRENRPQAIEALRSNGVGAIYNFQISENTFRKMRIVGYKIDSKTGSMEVTAQPADNRTILDFVNEHEVSFTVESPDSPSIPNDPEAGLKGNPRSVGIDVGIEAGAIAGLQVALILGSGLNAKIEQAYARIAELERQMGSDFDLIQQARISLNGVASKVIMNGARVQQELKLSAGTKTLLTKDQLKVAISQSNLPSESLHWKSEDPEFLKQANQIQIILQKHPPKDSIEQSFYQISKQSLILADQQSFFGANDNAFFLLDVAKTAADVLVGLDPFTGTARSLYEAVSGENMITGQQLSSAERTLATLGVLTGGITLKGIGAFRFFEKLAITIAPHTQKTWVAVRSFFRATGNSVQLVGEIEPLRKINFRQSAIDSHWGLTKIHLQKHFFGNHKYSLKSIDPGGNSDKWMHELMELAQRPETRTLTNGAIDVVGEFTRADKAGAYKLGLRLWPKEDGTFDLITVLTNQGKF